MSARQHARIALTLVLLAAGAAARADEVHLTNGNRLEGKTRKEGDKLVLETPRGEMRFDPVEVKSVTVGPTRMDKYQALVAKALPRDVAAHLAVADWCRDQKLADLEKKHLRAVVALDPEHAAARERLGFVRYEDKWVTEDEYYKARGFEKVGKEWVAKEELERRRTTSAAATAGKTHLKRVSAAVGKMSSPRRAIRQDGRVALQKYAEEIGDLHLAQFATDVATYYNEAWRAVKAEYAAMARVDVRATMTSLKRPIPTISTSLGANTTPVTIQLPELSVVSIKTTANVPITIELDDE